MKVAAVVPTCRGFTIPDQSIDVDWYIVHDREKWPVYPQTNDAACHVVNPDAELYGRRSDTIRSAGFMQAYQDGADYILTVDDDCRIPFDWAEQHVEALQETCDWWNNTHPVMDVRGMPYDLPPLRVGISHGLWDGVPDLDGRTQKNSPWTGRAGDGEWRRIYAPFPQSAMNFGFRREVAAAMYQPAQGEGTPFDRFGDIWGGMLAQRVLEHHGYAFMNGGAVVWHDRASDVETNIRKEAPGMDVHEDFFLHVWSFNDWGSTLAASYCRLGHHVSQFQGTNGAQSEYFGQLGRNMFRWVSLIDSSVREEVSA